MGVLTLTTISSLTACDPGYVDIHEQTRQKAADLVRTDIRAVADAWGPAVADELGSGRDGRSVLAAGERAATAVPVVSLTFLKGSVSQGKAEQGVAVVRSLTDTSGMQSASETVRVCAALAVGAEQQDATVESIACPADLSRDVPGLGTVTATVPYS